MKITNEKKLIILEESNASLDFAGNAVVTTAGVVESISGNVREIDAAQPCFSISYNAQQLAIVPYDPGKQPLTFAVSTFVANIASQIEEKYKVKENTK